MAMSRPADRGWPGASGAVKGKCTMRTHTQDWDPAPPKRPRLGAGSKCGGRRLIVVLEGASLETVKVVLNMNAEVVH